MATPPGLCRYLYCSSNIYPNGALKPYVYQKQTFIEVNFDSAKHPPPGYYSLHEVTRKRCAARYLFASQPSETHSRHRQAAK